MPPNNAIHLSRRRKDMFFAERTLRAGDGKRSDVFSSFLPVTQ